VISLSEEQIKEQLQKQVDNILEGKPEYEISFEVKKKKSSEEKPKEKEE